MYEKELIVIALYPGMKEEVRDICNYMQINPTIIEWDVAEFALIEHLRTHFSDNGRPDVIISRGAIANMMEQYFPEVASVRAEAEELSLLACIQEASRYGSRIGILMFEEFAVSFNLTMAKKLLRLPELKLYPFRSGEDIRRQVRQGLDDGLDAMVGTRMAWRTGKQIGLPVIALDSGSMALHKALRQAVSIIQARQMEKIQLRSFNEAVASIQEGVLTVENGIVIMANKVACDVFRVAESNMIGKRILDLSIVKLSENIHRFLTDENSNDEVLKIQNRNYYVRKTYLNTETMRRMILVLRSVKDIQDQEKRVRTELRSDGFLAKYHFPDIIAESSVMQQLLDKAQFYAMTDANILITGESGTGKELLAQSIHNASSRKNEPFVAVNCAAIPATLLESELFGYEEGAFSGARKGGKRGLFELAHKGTIFLDEINSMPIELQSAFLRVLQEKEIRRLGSQRNIYVDVRVIAASNRNLTELIAEEKFRTDLYYRLNTLRLSVPSLNERQDDIRALTLHYLRYYSDQYRTDTPTLSDPEYLLLENRSWPGNVRELSNVMHRYVILNMGQATPLTECFDSVTAVTPLPCEPPASSLESAVSDFPAKSSAACDSRLQELPPAAPFADCDNTDDRTLEEIERSVILSRLERNNGNRKKTAEDLGIARSTLWKKLEEYQHPAR